MNSYFAGNEFTISDRLDIDNPGFTNIWGVSDQDFFRHSREYFDKISSSGSSFFSIIMTTSNHSPYNFPAGIISIPAEWGGGRWTVFPMPIMLLVIFSTKQRSIPGTKTRC